MKSDTMHNLMRRVAAPANYSKQWLPKAMIRVPAVQLLWLAFLVALTSGQQFPGTGGFISIDCGGQSGYTDNTTQIPWLSDSLPTGQSYTLNTTNVDRSLLSLRAFSSDTSPIRNCYSVSVRPGTAYLVRAGFMYANYDNVSRPPQFELYLDTTLWQVVDLSTSPPVVYYEAITSPDRFSPTGSLNVCLVRTIQQVAPLINSLELRPLPNSTYVGRLHRLLPSSVGIDVNLYLISRVNFGGPFLRFPQDKYDRFWQGYDFIPAVKDLPALNAMENQTFSQTPAPTDLAPDAILQTAISAPNISFTLPYFPLSPFQAYTWQYSCEFDALPSGTKRQIDWSVYTNLHGVYMPFVPSYDNNFTLDRQFSCVQYGLLNESMSSNFTSRLGNSASAGGNPVLNALEIYSIAPVTPGTNAADVQALSELKKNLGRKNWTGDPCLPAPWDGIECDSASRVKTLDLSRMKLSGSIPTSIGKLTSLEYLSLANNSFSGPIPDLSALKSLVILNLAFNHLSGMFPDWILELQNLTELNIDNNQIWGPFPHSLADNLGSNFSYKGNMNLCDDSAPLCIAVNAIPPSADSTLWAAPPEANDNNGTDFILGMGAGILITILVANTLFIIYCICRCRTPKYHKPSESSWPTPGTVGAPQNAADIDIVHQMYPTERRLRAQCYPYSAIKSATSDFSRRIGEGGFGPVYYGVLGDGQEIAVKVVPVKLHRETQVVLDELDVLSVGLHKNVVPLVGYSQNVNQILFIYAYMAEGDLQTRLYGPNAASFPLTWKERLRIAVDSAEGLEYLHHACKPCIVHRNVKSTNIFLSKCLEGKAGHYGVSKLTDEGGGNISNIVHATKGYLDPEYFTNRQLTAKSDVYSFGVLLLEILCGRAPILDPKSSITGHCTNIVDWVRGSLQNGTLEVVMDPGLKGHYNLATAWNIAEIAIHCVEMNSKSRPTMTEVVLDLTRAVDMDSTSDVRSQAALTYSKSFVYHDPHNLPAV